MHKVNLGPLTLLVLQPTSFCNIDCSYCYLPNRHLKNAMSDDVLAWALRRAFLSGLVGEKIDILWHAGEPLIVGTDFYWNASRKIAEFNVNSVQSLTMPANERHADRCPMVRFVQVMRCQGRREFRWP